MHLPSLKKTTYACFTFYVATWAFDLISTMLAFNHYGAEYFIEHELTQSITQMFMSGKIPADHIVLNFTMVVGIGAAYFAAVKRERELNVPIVDTILLTVAIFMLIVGTIFAVLHVVAGLSWWI